MRPITTDQSHQVMAVLATNTNWSEIDFEESGLQDSIIRNSKEMGRQFTAFLKNGGRMNSDFPIWRAIKLGTGIKDGKSFIKAIEDAGKKVSEWAKDMLGKKAFTAASQEMKVELVKLTVRDLGFAETTRYDKICERALQLGLQLCPNEVGPQLRLQYVDQPNGEWIWVAMEAIRASDGDLSLFGVEHDGNDLWLNGSCADPGDLFDPDNTFVFVRPRK